MRSVLFVCTANLCRSPMAEAVFRRLLEGEGLQVDVEVDSAGTHDYHAGKPAFPLADRAARKRGYDVGGCIARRVTMADFDRFDHILAMDRANVAHLTRIAPTPAKRKIELLLDYGVTYYGAEVPDPYTGSEFDFELALDMIEDGCRGLLHVMTRAARQRSGP